MIRFFYNSLLLILLLVTLPKRLWERFAYGKYRSSLSARFGHGLPQIDPQQKVVWIHAVSVGEVKAVSACYKELCAKYPDYAFVISTTTETGLNEARKSLPGAHVYFILPFDFSWVMKRVMKRLHPSCIILCESDFWYNMLSLGKAQGAKIALINGKLSERSFDRFSKFPQLANRLFSLFDCVCVQSKEHEERFLRLNVPKDIVHVTGNLKLEMPVNKLSSQEKQALQKHLGVTDETPVIVIGSTHAPEEKELLEALSPLWEKFPALKILIVPRHPERFDEVAAEIKLPFSRFSKDEICHERLILVDAMGVLTKCYQIATVAIVAGSYGSKIGGHNIYEPIQYGAPTFFGPHMHTQKELVSLVTEAGAGKQVDIESLDSEIEELFSVFEILSEYRCKGELLTRSIQGSLDNTLQAICLVL